MFWKGVKVQVGCVRLRCRRGGEQSFTSAWNLKVRFQIYPQLSSLKGIKFKLEFALQLGFRKVVKESLRETSLCVDLDWQRRQAKTWNTFPFREVHAYIFAADSDSFVSQYFHIRFKSFSSSRLFFFNSDSPNCSFSGKVSTNAGNVYSTGSDPMD